jgi:hypothetical protein
MRRIGSLLLVLGFVVAACGSSGKKGDSCTEEGQISNCDKPLLCAKSKAGGSDLVCSTTCVGQEDCGPNENCNGLGLNIPKVCQQK